MQNKDLLTIPECVDYLNSLFMNEKDENIKTGLLIITESLNKIEKENNKKISSLTFDILGIRSQSI